MKRLLILAFLFVPAIAFAEVPTINIPPQCREKNWVDPITNEGSCVFATMTMSLRWMLAEDEASYWRNNFAGGQWASNEWNPNHNLPQKFESRNIPYAYTTSGDEEFLTWAIATRRGAGITVRSGSHMVLLVDLTDTEAALIDSNEPNRIVWVNRNRLIAEWQNSHGWAVTPVLSPAPPLP